jgi:uncharacterized membrane protein YjdF
MKDKALLYTGIHGLAAQPDARAARRSSRSGSERVPAVLLASFGAVWLALAISPVNRSDWLLKSLLVAIVVPWLIATRTQLRFSNAAYTCIFLFLIMHAVGAHFIWDAQKDMALASAGAILAMVFLGRLRVSKQTDDVASR